MIRLGLSIFGRNVTEQCCDLFNTSCQCRISVYLITDDIHFDHLIDMVPTKLFFNAKLLLFFPLLLMNVFQETLWNYINILIFIKLSISSFYLHQHGFLVSKLFNSYNLLLLLFLLLKSPLFWPVRVFQANSSSFFHVPVIL